MASSSAAQSSMAVATPSDGSMGLEEKRKRRNQMYLACLGGYFAFGMVFYGCTEAWSALETTVFTLSVLTGVGYGHLIPTTKFGLVFTAAYIFTGLVIFATVAGQILDWLISAEIDMVTEAVRHCKEGEHKRAHHTMGEQRAQRRRRHFVVGSLNVGAIIVFSIILFVAYFGLPLPEALYYTSISVLKLDSICLLDGVECSHGHHAHGGGQTISLIFSIIWAFTTYAIVGHFLVSATHYFGVESSDRMTSVSTVTTDRLLRMDSDGDMKVNRSEFLRDRLIQGNVCDKEQIDRILKNFDEMDKDNSGVLNTKDLK